MSWKVLFEGDHGSCKKGDCVHLPNHSGSVSIIQDEDRVIMVDTSNRHRFEDVEAGLEEMGLSWDDITDVVLTHLHLDHAGNVGRLPKHVNLYAWQHNWTYGETIRMPSLHQFEITKKAVIHNAPGHTPDHNVLVYTHEGETVIFAGDAMNAHFFNTNEVKALNNDHDLYRKTADWIIETADVIVPGHGPLLYPKDRPKF